MAIKLTAAQQAQLSFLQSMTLRLDQLKRLVEEMASLKMDDVRSRQLARQLDELKAGAAGLSLAPIADTLGMMSMLARRGGGLQTKIRGLREGLASLRILHEGAVRSASAGVAESEEPDEA